MPSWASGGGRRGRGTGEARTTRGSRPPRTAGALHSCVQDSGCVLVLFCSSCEDLVLVDICSCQSLRWCVFFALNWCFHPSPSGHNQCPCRCLLLRRALGTYTTRQVYTLHIQQGDLAMQCQPQCSHRRKRKRNTCKPAHKTSCKNQAGKVQTNPTKQRWDRLPV